MKKLMTLLSAAAVAFGLQAADTGTSFEGMDPGNLDITSTTGELSGGPGYWVTNGSSSVTLTVVEGESVNRDSDYAIQQYLAENQERYLSVKTGFGNPLTRKIKTGNAGQTIGNGFYFDSQVKFTAFDDDPMTTAVTNDFEGAKIAVWVKEVYSEEDPDVVTATNLYIRAGYLGGEPQTYDCGQLLNPAAWHRLTIKAIENIYSSGGQSVPGFVVFIDNQPVGVVETTTKGVVEGNLNEKYLGFYRAGALYPSMVQDGTDDATMLSSVAFDGQGEVDDIVFTETVPFSNAKDSEYVTVSWDADDITAISINGESKTVADGVAKLTYTSSFTPAISVTYKEGKLAGTWTGTATIEGTTVTFTAAEQTCEIVADDAAASFQGTAYATLGAAIAAAEAASTTVPPPVLKLYNTSASDDIEIAPNALIVIDLNGQEIGGISTKDALQIIDSVGGGTVKGEVYLGEESVINAGTFDEMVTLGDGSVINGGRFIFDLNEGQVEEFAAEGYEFVAGSGDDEGYLVLVEKAEEVDFVVSVGANSYVSEVIVNGFDVTTSVTNGTLEAVSSNATWSVTFTANSGYEFEGGLTTTNFTGTAEAAVDLTGPDAAAQQGGGWVDPGTIPADTDAGTQYPKLADSDLAETDAKKLTEWADTYTVGIDAVAAAAPNSVIYDAYLLGCEPTAAAVAEAKEDFVPSIAIVDGEVIVTEPDGDYNGRLIKKGSANLEDWYDANTNEGYNFFKYELVP